MKMSDSQVKSESPETQTLQDRLRCLQELTDFTVNCKNQLDELFETLGWKQDCDQGSAQEPMEVCPYYPNHRVPSRTMERHKVACLLRKMGYSQEEQAEMVDPSVYYEKANISCFTMDRQTQQQVILQARASALPLKTDRLYSQGEYSKDPPDVPQNHKREICDLTVADRLALYDHVTREARQEREQAGASNNEDLYVDLVAKLKKGDDQNGPKSHLELMAEMRDYKRRRQSYRAKNVHITKKSYTEVIREVIDVHSSELARQWKDEREEELGETKRPHRRGTEDRRSPSAESLHSHISSRDGHGSHHRKRHRSRERNRDRAREPSRDPGHEPSRDRGREPSRDPGREPSRDGAREPSRDPGREPSRDPGREPSRDRAREPSRDPGREPSRDRGREPSRDRGREPSRDRGREPSRDRGREPSRDRAREPSRDRAREPSRDRAREPSRDRAREPSRDRAREPSRDRGREPSRDRGREPSRDRGREPSQERVREKEGKKKRKRDSRSPDERHHDKKKKKKKKKKEGKEKEKEGKKEEKKEEEKTEEQEK